jgi:hypothetical protein
MPQKPERCVLLKERSVVLAQPTHALLKQPVLTAQFLDLPSDAERLQQCLSLTPQGVNMQPNVVH